MAATGNPAEIEDVIAALPGVTECAVIGVPDQVTDEAVKAFVVKGGANLSDEDIVAHCRRNLTNYKVPKSVEFRTDLPKSPIGKVLRRELRSSPNPSAATKPDMAGPITRIAR